MSFDPDVVRLFAQLQQSGQPAMDTLPIEGARAMMRALGAQLGFPRVEMAQVRDLHADTAAGPVPLRLYRPSDLAPGPAPTCLFVHGGGGVVGDLDSHDDVCRQLAACAGCQLLAVDYRLAPEHPAPAGVEDVIATLQWLVAQPHVVGADPAIAQDWRVSPMLVPDVAGVAPALVVVGDRDMLCDEGRAYAERLRGAGVEVTLHSFPGMIHGFINMGGVLRAADETLALAALVLRQRLLPAIGRWASD
ncbi:alpha/beta hydrolase [Xanthomonas hortorum]|uniref:Acetyl esterase n=1 Tax=Xanthomonas hortorum pv. pelargonii TaxID=453602 RepID=A0A6V7BML2_9XANT|nr:alpha/beta hydrolase fold domain-containing protein [Xanthomonas hortorum]MCE4355195.1 alpha/beta hydrolase [Xanthomonas hortorum pv. pelargonii]MCM5523729.1 alpha/beta hydrolase [Xanthomonas hortorum pv. pelargonii]MCM5536276.1 alpha/beta hydrolase [Xanthomonas hortorum pv. pelargonii]MCM5540421.1 alpha/beta hydrolase [Xanthomonas hortorum pv. pelargonii]MCM5545351.1 alpha/beta hydrolase [Xanthomonas hortorum pv. pelargonii]